MSTNHLTFVETIRSAFPDTDNFSYMYETLAKGYVIIRITEGSHTALIKTRICETEEQNAVFAEVAIERLKQKLRLPPQPLQDLIAQLGMHDDEVSVDEDKFKNFKKDFDAKYTDEENQEARDATQNALLNRKWLRDNKRSLETTWQTIKFHKLANMYRLDGNLEERDFMWQAWSEAVKP